MYYHCRPLKYVVYGKVDPPPEEYADEYFLDLFKWLGCYCGYCPQIWLSRSHNRITGFKRDILLKKSRSIMRKRQDARLKKDSVLFGFENIQGFPVSYDHWEYIMIMFCNNGAFKEKNLKKENEFLTNKINEFIISGKKEGFGEEDMGVETKNWVASGRNLDVFLKNHLFVEKDQVVVPSLNLKSAKQIICRDEKQKKRLRQMGFIEDRILIKNIKHYTW